MQILLVDDDAAILRGLVKMIQGMNGLSTEIRTARNGPAALELMREFTPDLMLVDVMMPAMSGIELIRCSRNNGYENSAALLTGYEDFGYAREAIRLRVCEYLLKPVNQEELYTLIKRICQTTDQNQNDKMLCASALGFPDYVIQDEKNVSPVFLRILDFIKSHYREELRLSWLSARFHISETYICTLFDRHIGTTFSTYLNTLRLRRAAYLILHTDQTIDEIAQDVGYKYGVQLLRVFKRRIGLTPSHFRQTGGEELENRQKS